MKKDFVVNNGIKITFSKKEKSKGVEKLFEKALSKEPKNDKDKLIQPLFGESKNE